MRSRKSPRIRTKPQRQQSKHAALSPGPSPASVASRDLRTWPRAMTQALCRHLSWYVSCSCHPTARTTEEICHPQTTLKQHCVSSPPTESRTRGEDGTSSPPLYYPSGMGSPCLTLKLRPDLPGAGSKAPEHVAIAVLQDGQAGPAVGDSAAELREALPV